MKTILIALSLAVGALGCAPVHQYQRGTLARDGMKLTGDSGESQLQAHMLQSREGASGGYGSAGGGCGCN
jgi:hypothetical protein